MSELKPHKFEDEGHNCNWCHVCDAHKSDPIHQERQQCKPCPGDPRGTGFCEFHECERDCQQEQCLHSRVNEGNMGDEGYVVECADCGEDLSPRQQEHPKGWINRQYEKISADVESWPAWMKREAGFEQSPTVKDSLTAQQEKAPMQVDLSKVTCKDQYRES